MLELINPFVAKILLTVKEGDSIRAVSKKIDASYGWTYKWIERLEDIGVLKRGRKGIRITNGLSAEFKSLVASILNRKLELKDAYVLPNFSGMKYAYTKIDAVFIWTQGGYQIGRSRKDYPLFLKVLREDLNGWKHFFGEYGMEYRIGKRKESEGEMEIYFVLFPSRDFKTERVGSSLVIPLEETIEWAQKFKYNFQPALEMLDEMYTLELDVDINDRGIH